MLEGCGCFIWQLDDDLMLSAEGDADAAKAAGLAHVEIKIADGCYAVNQDLLPGYVKAFHQRGLQVWGWHYVYGEQPGVEAALALDLTEKLGLDGYIIDAEGEFDTLKSWSRAASFMDALAAKAAFPLALSSYRYPSVHPAFPWQVFEGRVQVMMPQVYWMGASNAAAQLQRCFEEYHLPAECAFVPVGAAFHEHGWQAQPAEIAEFGRACTDLRLAAFSFWEWANARRYGLFDALTLCAADWNRAHRRLPRPKTWLAY